MRRAAVEEAVRYFAPRIPRFEREAVCDHALMSRGLATAVPGTAAWLSLVAYVRHTFTDYYDLLAEGYDLESARHFVLDDINAVLSEWGARRMVEDDEGSEGA